MAQYKWVRENVKAPQDNEQVNGREIGSPMSNLAAEGWEPVTAVSDPTFSDTVLVLMRRAAED